MAKTLTIKAPINSFDTKEYRFTNGGSLSYNLEPSISSGSTITNIKITIPIIVKGTPSSDGNFKLSGSGETYFKLGNINIGSSSFQASGVIKSGNDSGNAILSANLNETINYDISTIKLQIYGKYDGFSNYTYFSGGNTSIDITYIEPSSSPDEEELPNKIPTTYSSPQLSYRSSTYNFRALSDGSMSQTIIFNVNPMSGTNRSFYCSDSNIIINNSTSSNPTATGNFKGGKSYTFYATNSYGMQSSCVVSFVEIKKLTSSISFDSNNTLIDSSPSDGYGLCKEIQKLKGTAYLNGEKESNIIGNWKYNFNITADIDEAKYDLDINSNTISVLDIKNKTASKKEGERVLEGYYYQIYYTVSYLDTLANYRQEVTSSFRILRYPKSLNNISDFYIDYVYNGGASGDMMYDKSDSLGDSCGYFNNNCYFNINYPSLYSNSGYSKIKTVNILLSDIGADDFNPVNPKYNNEQVVQSYAYGQQPNSYNIDITNINRGNYINLGVKLIDYLGQSITINRNKNDDSNVYFSRIKLPYFGTTTINSSAPSIIKINYNPILSSTNKNRLSLAIPTPYTYNTIQQSTLTNSYIVSLLKTLKLREKNANEFFSFDLSKDNVSYNAVTATGYIYITLSDLKEKFNKYLTQNKTLELKINLSFTDAFGNECSQDFTINHFDNTINDVIILNFGAPPVMPDYNSSHYYMNISYDGIDNKKLVNNNTMINSGDILSITFPKATDANGESDIQKYVIKIYRSDSNLSSYTINDNEYQQLAELNKVDFDSALSNNLYTYNHMVNNYLVAKFIKLAVIAVDSQNLESNIIEYPFTLIAGRLDSSKSSIKSFQDNGNNTYNFNLSINDIGGNIFNNKEITYMDYPNLEREYNLYGNSRSITIDIEHRDSNDLDSTVYKNKLEKINFKVGNLSETNNYTNSYNTILSNYISINNLNLSTFNINSSIKNYYRFIIKVQVGFDKSGNPIYKIGYSSTYVSYPSTPTVAYRKNHIGLNTDSFNNYDNAILVAAAGVDSRNILYFISENNISLVNVENGEIDGFIIDGGEW